MKKPDQIIIVFLLAVGILVHFIGLKYPDQVVFDEVHFGKFVTAYCCTHQNFFDIHPPHAKLLIAGAAWLGGYRGGFSFDHIGQEYAEVPIEALRFIPALAGSILAAIIYGLLRKLGVSRQLAVISGLAVVLENATIVQTRMISLDGVLLVAIFGSLSCYLSAEKNSGRKKYYWLVGAGALAGLAVGTKFTGLTIVGLLGVMLAVEWIKRIYRRENWRETIRSGGVIAIAAILVYLTGWVIHFSLLDLPGSGDAFHKTDFSENVVIDFFRETYELHKVMLSANYGLKATHDYASQWWQWPIMQRSVFYWQSEGRMIYFLGNPAVWLGSGLLLAVAMISALILFGQKIQSRWVQQAKSVRIWIPVIGYLIGYIPLMRVPRSLFLYHYLTPLLFGILTGTIWLEIVTKDSRDKSWYQIGTGVIFGLIVLGFVWWSPLTYGWLAPDNWMSNLFWVPSWR